jgi:hypothetical protein
VLVDGILFNAATGESLLDIAMGIDNQADCICFFLAVIFAIQSDFPLSAFTEAL